jgi:hypothetical protein
VKVRRFANDFARDFTVDIVRWLETALKDRRPLNL